MTSLRRPRAVAIILPIVLLLVWGAISWQAQRETAVAVAQLRADIVREYVLRVLEAQSLLLEEAAAIVGDRDLSRLDPADRRALHDRLDPLDERLAHTLDVAVVSPAGRVVAASSVHPADLDVTGREFFRDRGAIEGLAHVSRVNLRPAGTDALLVVRPQRRGASEPGGLIVAAAGIDAFSTFFAQIADVPESAAFLMRADGTVLIGRERAGAAPPLRAGGPPAGAADNGGHGLLEGADGLTRLYAFAPVGDYPLFAVYGVPRGALVSAWLHELAIVGVLLAVLSLLGYLLFVQMRKRLFAERARERAAFDRRRLEEAREAAEQSRLMLEEAHHRIKNSLQLVSSFISLGGREGGDAETVLFKVSERVRAISTVHDLLYESNMPGAEVDLVPLLRRVSESSGLAPSEADIAIDFDSSTPCAIVAAATAVSVTLIVVELIINSGKHAFRGRSEGRIAIHLDVNEEAIRVEVADDGVGLPGEGEAARSSGLKLVDGILRQLGGTLERRSGNGASFLLTVARTAARPAPADEPVAA